MMVEVEVSSRTGREEYAQYKQESQKAFEKFRATHSAFIEERYAPVMAEYLKEQEASDRRYMSGEGTATFCKKCAFLWDMREMMLCGNCKTKYHHFRYSTCFDCISEERKLEIKEQRVFEAEMDAMMAKLDKLLEQANGSGESE
jgi:hypothetical protein